MRAPLCSALVIAFHIIYTFIFGSGEGDVEGSINLLRPLLERYPSGALMLFFDGRITQLGGEVKSAVTKFNTSIESQSEWKQFHHVCYWELMWCHCFQCNWAEAVHYADSLAKESRWSKPTYLYQKASFLAMDPANDWTTVKQAFEKVLGVRVIRYAGKRIPIEKFCVEQTQKILNKDRRPVLPALEFMYLWNGFLILKMNGDLLNQVLEVVLAAEKAFEEDDHLNANDECLILLLKGMCLKCLEKYDEAEVCFLAIGGRAGEELDPDSYLQAFALLELGLLFAAQERYSEARATLLAAQVRKDYLMEFKLHFRAHGALSVLPNGDGKDAKGDH